MAWDTLRGRVIAALVARLQTMTVLNGYHWDTKATSVVTDVANIVTVPDTELPFHLLEPAKPSQRQYDQANQLQEWMALVITTRLSAPGTDVHRKTQAGENMIGGLEKALTADITLGGLLFDLRIGPPDPPMMGLGNNNNVVV